MVGINLNLQTYKDLLLGASTYEMWAALEVVHATKEVLDEAVKYNRMGIWQDNGKFILPTHVSWKERTGPVAHLTREEVVPIDSYIARYPKGNFDHQAEYFVVPKSDFQRYFHQIPEYGNCYIDKGYYKIIQNDTGNDVKHMLPNGRGWHQGDKKCYFAARVTTTASNNEVLSETFIISEEEFNQWFRLMDESSDRAYWTTHAAM